VLTDMSTVGAAAGIANPANTSTYVGRLRQFGLLDVAPRQGNELADFNTVQTAEDMDSIRRALGATKTNFLGFSYGTELGRSTRTCSRPGSARSSSTVPSIR
jgi:pimeloyl-ACP methyl ester carboxylesterase